MEFIQVSCMAIIFPLTSISLAIRLVQNVDATLIVGYQSVAARRPASLRQRFLAASRPGFIFQPLLKLRCFAGYCPL